MSWGGGRKRFFVLITGISGRPFSKPRTFSWRTDKATIRQRNLVGPYNLVTIQWSEWKKSPSGVTQGIEKDPLVPDYTNVAERGGSNNWRTDRNR
jgi:hypothetical protein